MMAQIRMLGVLAITMLVWTVPRTLAFPSGLVTTSCSSLTPDTGAHGSMSTAPHDLSIDFASGATTYEAGNTYQIVLSKASGNFKGFFCQVRAGDDIIGSFTGPPSLARLHECTNVNDAISHDSSVDKTSMTFTWQSPSSGAPASVQVMCAVVIVQDTWHRLTSSAIVLTAGGTQASPMPMMTMMATPAQPSQPGLAIDLSTCGESKGCRRTPEGCESPAECSYIFTNRLIGADTVEIELSAAVSGWVAVGFSTDERMGNDDVLACQADSTGRVNAKDLFNPGYSNRLDADAVGITNMEGTLTNGVLSCRFRRLVAGGGPHDLDLSLEHTLFFATHPTRTGSATASLNQHTTVPELSAGTFTVASTANIGSRPLDSGLIAAHAGVMIYAWIAIALNGMFSARFMRKAFGAPRWYQFHWVTMMITLILSLCGGIIIGVHAKRWKPSAHSGVGLTVLVFAGLQGIVAFFRPAPDAEKRWMFTMFHRANGSMLTVLSWVAIFLGFQEANRVLVINLGGAYGVLGGGIAVIGGYWAFMEYMKKQQGDKDLDCAESGKMKNLYYLFTAVAYGFTIGSASFTWSLDARS